MNIIHILAIAIGLSADSFVVSTTEGMLLKHSRHIHSLRVAIVFAICQGLMPIIGWHIGAGLFEIIHSYANWAAFVILTFIGGRMIYHSFCPDNYSEKQGHSIGLKLWLLGIAISIDALGVGISMGMTGAHIWFPAMMIGLITAISCFWGVQLGEHISKKTGGQAEKAGGTALIIVAISFLL